MKLVSDNKVASELVFLAKELASLERIAYADPANLADLSRMTIDQIADLVAKDWKNVNYAAKPYLSAMFSMTNISDNYGMDSGTSIVCYFLANANSWKGDVAREVKKELNRRIRR